MVTIEAKATIKSNTIAWLFDGENVKQAVSKAKATFKAQGLAYKTYILI